MLSLSHFVELENLDGGRGGGACRAGPSLVGVLYCVMMSTLFAHTDIVKNANLHAGYAGKDEVQDTESNGDAASKGVDAGITENDTAQENVRQASTNKGAQEGKMRHDQRGCPDFRHDDDSAKEAKGRG